MAKQKVERWERLGRYSEKSEIVLGKGSGVYERMQNNAVRKKDKDRERKVSSDREQGIKGKNVW